MLFILVISVWLALGMVGPGVGKKSCDISIHNILDPPSSTYLVFLFKYSP